MPQKPVKFTDKFLEKYKPTTSRDEIFDKGGNGLGLRVTPTSKVFFFVRRVKGEKTRFTLGRYPAMSLAKARSEAHSLLDRIQRGEDPRTDIAARMQAKAEQLENTFAHAGKRFLAEYAEGKKRPLSKSSIRSYKWALQGDLTEKWADSLLADIVDRDVIRVIDKLEAKKQFASALLFRAHLRKFFSWASSKRLIRDNPAQNVSLASEPSDFRRDRVLSIEELQAVLRAARGMEDPLPSYVATLILCGQRRGETALMKWSDLELNGDGLLWRIPAENSKNRQAHTVALAPEAAGILNGLPHLGEYVFASPSNPRISAFSTIKKALDDALTEAKLKPWRLHDLRRSVATGIAELGFAPHVVEMILNHVGGEKAGIAGLYNRSRYESDCQRALAAWAKVVTATTADNVIALRSA